MMTYLAAHWLEVAGTLLSLVYLYFSINQKAIFWLFGLLSSLLYVVVFTQTKFYADASLQVYYVVISLYGLWNWRYGKKVDTKGHFPIQGVALGMWITLAAVTALIWIGYYQLLVNFTDSEVAFVDSLTTACSITATWMLAKKMLHQWILWIFIDLVSATVYLQKGLYTTAVLFLIYTVMAYVGYRKWLVEYRKSGVKQPL